MATISQTIIVPPIQMAGADALLYTAPTSTTTKIGRAVFFNSDTVVHTITINITNVGTSSAANEILTRTVSPSETYVSPELAGAVLLAGWQLRGFADTAAKVTIYISGITIV